MPANLKEVRTRIQSVKSTQQITKAMKMVSAAKLRKATDRIVQIRPYSEKLSSVLSNIASSGSETSVSFAEEREVNNVLIVAITSDRGLCGAFNANVVKEVNRLLKDDFADLAKSGDVSLMSIGKKGYDGLKKSPLDLNDTYKDLFLDLKFEKASVASSYIMDAFERKIYDKVIVVYEEFKNAAVYFTRSRQFLPVVQEEKAQGEEKAKNSDYIFEPAKEEILTALIPKILKTQFFRYLLDSNAAEHGARMTAMDKATENAEDLLKELRLSYNRARQAAITTELTEIVSGAAALSAE